MEQAIAGRLAIILMGIVLAASTAPAAAQARNSGFLRDYASLQEMQDAGGETVRAWVSPNFTPANYNAVLLDPLVFYPEPRPSEKVSADTLQQILSYANSALRHALDKRFKLVDQAGAGVVRLRIAITSVAAKDEGLKPYQLVPLAFVVTMASRAAEGTPQQAFVVVETEATDSATGALLGERVRTGTGKRLAAAGSQSVIKLENLKPLIDELTAAAYPNLSQYVEAK
jgi:hypothetical protein